MGFNSVERAQPDLPRVARGLRDKGELTAVRGDAERRDDGAHRRRCDIEADRRDSWGLSAKMDEGQGGGRDQSGGSEGSESDRQARTGRSGRGLRSADERQGVADIAETLAGVTDKAAVEERPDLGGDGREIGLLR